MALHFNFSNYGDFFSIISLTRELYLIFMRMVSCFEIVKGSEIDTHPVTGSADPTSLVTIPRWYDVYFKPRNAKVIGEVLKAKEAEGAFK